MPSATASIILYGVAIERKRYIETAFFFLRSDQIAITRTHDTICPTLWLICAHKLNLEEKNHVLSQTYCVSPDGRQWSTPKLPVADHCHVLETKAIFYFAEALSMVLKGALTRCAKRRNNCPPS